MNEKKFFLKTKNKIDEPFILSINKLSSKNLERDICNNPNLNLSYLNNNNDIFEVFFNSLLNELHYILKDYISKYSIKKNQTLFRNVIKAFYLSKYYSLQKLIEIFNDENRCEWNFILCSRDRFNIPINYIKDYNIYGNGNNIFNKVNIFTDRIYTFINPSLLSYYKEIFYPTYISEKETGRKGIFKYDIYYNFRILTKNIINRISLFPDLDWIINVNPYGKNYTNYYDLQYFYAGDNFNISKDSLYSEGSCNSIEKRRYLVTTNNTISKRSYTNVKNFKENELRYQFKYKSIDSFDVNYLKYLFNILNSFYKRFMKYTDSILIKLVLAENKNIGFDSESTNKGVSIIDYYLTLFDDDFYRYEIENIQNTFHKRSYLFSRESEEIDKTPEFFIFDGYLNVEEENRRIKAEQQAKRKALIEKKKREEREAFIKSHEHLISGDNYVEPKNIILSETRLNDIYDYEIYKDFYEEVEYHNPYISEIKRVISRNGSIFGISL